MGPWMARPPGGCQVAVPALSGGDHFRGRSERESLGVWAKVHVEATSCASPNLIDSRRGSAQGSSGGMEGTGWGRGSHLLPGPWGLGSSQGTGRTERPCWRQWERGGAPGECQSRCPEAAKPWAKGTASGQGDGPRPLNAIRPSSQSRPPQFLSLVRVMCLHPILHLRSPRSHLIKASGLNPGSCGVHPTEAPLGHIPWN